MYMSMNNDTPEKVYIHKSQHWGLMANEHNITKNGIEYTRTDAFIEKACEFLKDHMAGYDICEDDIERSVESFKLAMTL